MKMKRSYCNPLDLGYRYQHMMENGKRIAYREAADPTLIYFKGVYYLFASMSGGFWHSSDLTDWKYHTNRDLLIYDYAPDVRQVGEYLYFCASRRGENCPILRTKDPLSDTFEQVSAPFDFWDPDLFCDDDGRVYLYWGCGNTDPIYGIEMDPDTMLPIGERRELIFEQADTLGYERCGENGNVPPKETSPVYQALKPFVNPVTGELQLPQALPAGGGFNREKLVKMFRSIGKPYIEGAFMTKHNGKYYLQYASPATQFNTYCDGVYVADAPLGPFTLQQSNPFSSKPGGLLSIIIKRTETQVSRLCVFSLLQPHRTEVRLTGKYRYLTFEDRKKIEAWHLLGDRPVDIAARLSVHHTTIYKELQRGATGALDANQREGYSAELAERRLRESFKRRGKRAPAAQ